MAGQINKTCKLVYASSNRSDYGQEGPYVKCVENMSPHARLQEISSCLCTESIIAHVDVKLVNKSPA